MKQLLASLTLIFFGHFLSAQKPFFDPAFGVKGQLLINNGNCANGSDINITGWRAVGVQPDGKVIGAFQKGFNLTRILPGGGVDSAFGVNGIITYNLGTTQRLQEVLIQPGGKILLAGSVDDAVQLIRLLPDGTPDSSFNHTGLLSIQLNSTAVFPTSLPYDEYLGSVQLTADNKYLIGGTYILSGPAFPTYGVVARINTDGTPDTGFGATGYCRIGQISDDGTLETIAQPDGTILAIANQSDATGKPYMQTWRLKTNGLPDSSFGVNGTLSNANLGPAACHKAIGQPNGTYYVYAYPAWGTLQSGGFITRFLPNGHPDSTYGTNGRYTPSQSGQPMIILDCDTLPGGALVIAATPTGSNPGLFLTAATPAGALNTSFGTNGYTTPPNTFPTGFVKSDPASGKILVFDVPLIDAQSHTAFDFKRFNLDGSPDGTFGTNGEFQYTHGGTIDKLQGLAATADKKILVAGITTGCDPKTQYFINRFTSHGIRDSSFGVNGSVTTPSTINEIHALVALPDNSFLLGGRTTNEGAFIGKYRPDGHPDSSFGVNGIYFSPLAYPAKRYSTLFGLAVQPDGKILFTGGVDSSGYRTSPYVARLSAQGADDNTFGSAGYSILQSVDGTHETAMALTLRPDGRILITTDSLTSRVRVRQLTAGGSVDNTFGNQGSFSYPYSFGIVTPRDIQLQPDGKALVLFIYNGGQYAQIPEYSGVFRLMPDGSRDTTFNSDVVLANTGHSGVSSLANQILLQKDGRIIIPCIENPNSATGSSFPNFMLVRLKTNGQADTTFSATGSIILPAQYGIRDEDAYPYAPPNPLAITTPALITRLDSNSYVFGGTVAGTTVDGWLTQFTAKDSILPNPEDTTSVTISDTIYNTGCRMNRFSWIANNDTTSLGFSVERSQDQTNWQQLAFVPPLAHQQGKTQYFYTDSVPQFPNAFYRIRLLLTANSGLYTRSIARSIDTTAPGKIRKPTVTATVNNGAYNNLVQFTITNQKTLDSIVLSRASSNGPLLPLAHLTPAIPLPSNNYAWSDGNNLVPGTTYTYRIGIFSPFCDQAFSDTVTVTLPATITPPPIKDTTTAKPPADSAAPIRVYPNPARDMIQVAITDHFDKGELQVLSFEGRILYKQEVSNPLGAGMPVSIAWLNPGLYYLKVITTQKTYITRFMRR